MTLVLIVISCLLSFLSFVLILVWKINKIKLLLRISSILTGIGGTYTLWFFRLSRGDTTYFKSWDAFKLRCELNKSEYFLGVWARFEPPSEGVSGRKPLTMMHLLKINSKGTRVRKGFNFENLERFRCIEKAYLSCCFWWFSFPSLKTLLIKNITLLKKCSYIHHYDDKRLIKIFFLKRNSLYKAIPYEILNLFQKWVQKEFFLIILAVSMTYGTIHTGEFHKNSSLFRLTSLGWTFYVAVATSILLVLTFGLILYVFKSSNTGQFSPRNSSKLGSKFYQFKQEKWKIFRLLYFYFALHFKLLIIQLAHKET